MAVGGFRRPKKFPQVALLRRHEIATPSIFQSVNETGNKLWLRARLALESKFISRLIYGLENAGRCNLMSPQKGNLRKFLRTSESTNCHENRLLRTRRTFRSAGTTVSTHPGDGHLFC